MNEPQDDITHQPSEDAAPLKFEAEATPKRNVARSKLWMPLVLIAALGIGAASYASLAYFFNWWPFGGLDAELKYFPDGVYDDSLRARRAVQQNEILQAQKERRPNSTIQEEDTRYGMKEEDIERVTTAKGDKDEITIVTSRKAIKVDEARERLINYSTKQGGSLAEYTEESVGSYKLYVRKRSHPFPFEESSTSFCIPESKILLLGTADTLRKILQRNKKPELSARMKKAYSEADFSNTIAVIHDRSNEEKEKGTAEFGLGGEGKTIEVEYLQIHHDTTVTYKVIYFCKDAAGAENLLQKVEQKFREGYPEETELDKERRANLKMSKDGLRVIVTTHVKEQTLIDDLKKEK